MQVTEDDEYSAAKAGAKDSSSSVTGGPSSGPVISMMLPDQIPNQLRVSSMDRARKGEAHLRRDSTAKYLVGHRFSSPMILL